MVVFLLAFSSIQLIIGLASAAQITAPNCTLTTFPWMYNSLGQNPCLVAAYLAAVCNDGAFVIPALLPGNSYNGPNGPDNTDLCKCNTVVYSLISACDACQGSPWTTYSEWSYNCTKNATEGTYPEGVPVGTRVPNWAYINPVPGDDWNLTAAGLIGESPEVTGTASFASTSTTVNTPTVAPGSSSTSSPSSSKSNSNTGAIAGGVGGGVVAASVVASVVAWFVIRRRRAHAAPSTAFTGEKNSDMGQIAVPYPLPFEPPPRLYDPSDPSTYPPQAPSPTIRTTGTTAPSIPYQGSVSDLQSNRQAYSGLPEI